MCGCIPTMVGWNPMKSPHRQNSKKMIVASLITGASPLLLMIYKTTILGKSKFDVHNRSEFQMTMRWYHANHPYTIMKVSQVSSHNPKYLFFIEASKKLGSIIIPIGGYQMVDIRYRYYNTSIINSTPQFVSLLIYNIPITFNWWLKDIKPIWYPYSYP